MKLQEKILVTVPEAAELLGLGRTFTYELIGQGQIPVVRFGKRVLVPVKFLSQYIETLVEWPEGFNPEREEDNKTSIPLAQEQEVDCI